TLFAWVAIRTRLARFPAQGTWGQFFGVACLGGIGFTMSLFIAALAFRDEALLESAKLGILAGSAIAAAAGALLLRRSAAAAREAATPAGMVSEAERQT